LNYWLLSTAKTFGNGGISFDYQKNLEWRLKVELQKYQPDLVGVSVMFSMQHEQSIEIIRYCKANGYRTMMGGVHASNDSERILNDAGDSLDYLGLYESDLSLPIFLDAVNGKRDWDEVGQVVVKADTEWKRYEKRIVPSGDDMPRPDYCGLPLAEYDSIGQVGTYRFLRDSNRRAASALSNRGCRAKCTFCSVRSFNGPGVRKREVDAVIDEIEDVSRETGIRHITWLDDDLLFDRARALRLFNGLADRNLDLTWDASNGLIAAAIDAELLDAMVRSGCVGFNLGIESGSPEILRAVKKPGTVEKYLECAELLKKYPQLFVKAFIIIGLPGETLKQIKQTVDLCLKMELDWHAIQILNPLPSTEIYRTMADQGLLEDGNETQSRGFMAGVFSSLNQRQREEAQKASAIDFLDILAGRDLDRVPDKGDLPDLWFLADYKTNYAPILSMTPGPKLDNKRKMLVDVCDRVTVNNPLGNYFLSVIERKLGNLDAAQERTDRTQAYLLESKYWQQRFGVLELV
jgi:radical SAM superfamily enzyme YgiQ (UPF0313 family)